MKMVSKEDQLNKICKHSLLGNISVVVGYYKCLEMGVEIEDLPEKIQSAKTVFLGSLEGLINADKSIFPKWFNRENAKRIRNMSNFNWEDRYELCQFYDWAVNYIAYLQNL